MAFQLLENQASGHIKVKKRLAMYFTWPLPVTLMRVQQMEKQGVPLYETWGYKIRGKVHGNGDKFLISRRV